jgi:hypothetical protein
VTGLRRVIDRPRPGPRAALWLSGALAAGWVLAWSAVAWGVWQNGVRDRDLMDNGRAATGVVAAVQRTAVDKLGYCRQLLQVTSRPGGSLTVPATRPCTDLWAPGDPIEVVLDAGRPPRAVVAAEALDRVATHALPVLVVALSAVLAGYPAGRWAIRLERHRSAGPAAD